ncbi:hypothetical protein GUJ93_ZPchr0012g19290 [Zizania palustris]|uniref:Uncharacterized protein n=1 Tax=Zizania palustris TaxID=103762 RepID=A0A8J6BSB5_ZIZPA|nr:hypothetical protein GUJ93_ZPchr0012g19290 [Zizania palustris]
MTKELWVAELSGIHVTCKFISWRVQPLKLRAHLAFEYMGNKDSTQETTDQLPSREVKQRSKLIFSSRLGAYQDANLKLLRGILVIATFAGEAPRVAEKRNGKKMCPSSSKRMRMMMGTSQVTAKMPSSFLGETGADSESSEGASTSGGASA